MDYGCQLYSTAAPGRLKELESIHKEHVRVYTVAFRTSPVELLHAEAYDLPLELRKNELGIRFLYWLQSNIAYTESLCEEEVDQNYEEATNPIGVHLRKLERRYIKK